MGWWILAGLVVLALVRRGDSAEPNAPALRPAVNLVDMSNDMVESAPAPAVSRISAPPPITDFYVAQAEVRYWHDLASAARAGDCAMRLDVSRIHA